MGALCVVILLGLAASTTQKPSNSESLAELLKNPEIEGLLKTLAAQDPDGSEVTPAKHSRHHGKNLNLMNIKNVNVVIKDNNLRKAERQLRQAGRSSKSHKHQVQEQNHESLRALCKITGRCGCNRADGKCDDDDDDNEFDNRQDLAQVISNLQQDVRNEQNPLNNLRCSCNQNLDGLRCGCKKRHPVRSGSNDKDEDVQDDDDNDEFEIIYLDKNADLGHSNVVMNQNKNAAKKKDNKKRARAVYGGVVPEVETSEETDDDSKLNVSPQDFFKYYETFKAMATNNLLAYVLHQNSDVDVSQLSRSQQKIVKNLRQVLPKLDKIDILKLRDRLESVIVGEDGPSVVLPHFENNHNIYVPQWVYTNLRSLKSSRSPALRKQKLFPLTKQQKEKLNNVIKNKIRVNLKVPRENNRRNFFGNIPDKGLPFELQVEGLGQVNP